MSNRGVEKRYSETAIFAALYRAIANKEFKNKRFGSDYLAEYFLPSHFKFFIKFKKIRVNVKNKESLKNVLEKAGYEKNDKTLFIWEGVSYYLEPESVDATLEFVNNSSHNESVIAFDYAISISEENINNYYGVKEFVQTWRKHRSDELFRFAIDEGKIESFLEQRGLKIVNHLDNKEIEKTFLLNENGSLIGQINGSFRFVLASPNNKSQKRQGT